MSSKTLKAVKQHRLSSAVLLLLIIAAAAAVKFSLCLRQNGIEVFDDEYIYKTFARLLHGGTVYASGQYPPLYPLVLSPAFFFGAQFYHWMHFINVILHSLAALVLYRTARLFLPRRISLILVFIFVFSPFCLYNVRLIRAENLYPLLCLAASWIFLKPSSGRGIFPDSLFIGAVLGAMWLTRHSTVFLISGFLFLWPIRLYLNDKKITLTNHIISLSVITAAVIAVYAPWAAAAALKGVSPLTAMGFHISVRDSLPGGFSVKLFLLWSGIYSAYLILITGPVLLAFFQAPFFFRGKFKDERLQLLILYCAMFTIGLLVPAARHSSLQLYNSDGINKIIGRYVSYALPLLLICFMTILLKIRQMRIRINAVYTGLSLAAAAAIYTVSWLFLVKCVIIPIDAPVAYRGNNATDILSYFQSNNPLVLLTFAAMLLTAVYLFADTKLNLPDSTGRASTLRKAFFPGIITAAVLFYFSTTLYQIPDLLARGAFASPANISGKLRSVLPFDGRSGWILYYDKRKFTGEMMGKIIYNLKFFDHRVERKTLDYPFSTDGKCVIISDEVKEGMAGYFRVAKKNYYIYTYPGNGDE